MGYRGSTKVPTETSDLTTEEHLGLEGHRSQEASRTKRPKAVLGAGHGAGWPVDTIPGGRGTHRPGFHWQTCPQPCLLDLHHLKHCPLEGANSRVSIHCCLCWGKKDTISNCHTDKLVGNHLHYHSAALSDLPPQKSCPISILLWFLFLPKFFQHLSERLF